MAAPLAGRRILITRARKQASALSKRLRDLGATVLEIPAIEIRPPKSYALLDDALARIEDYDWLILTSVNGVEALFERLARRKQRPSLLHDIRVCAIGPATRAAVEERGVEVDVVPKKYVAESVVAALRRRVKGKRVLLVRAKVARDVIPRELRRAGATVDVVEAYETVVPAASRSRLRAALAFPARRPHAITFTSSSTVRNFVELLGSKTPAASLRGILLASIGPVTSGTLRECGLKPSVEARAYTIDGLVDAIVRRLASR